ncbi:HcpA family protein [Wohlfahrtiimonas chitiniclastica]|uniref:tetratricopeptide repeat protein n=1 Tax=Wohlfahrtiimonas chitiniclastica TaxID=400946 RepID=UPI0007B40A3A|nr:tetratricopeptide repeat protein [Wohlfahrtiimonas chitiniclastica]KZS23261.1 Sel1 repeat protein [Wohlfahrtiimonas chitiniclastica]MDC7252110.1 hypothetical protein [Wohlfahrtiimonas chitiniclastica]WHR55683.1 HcpA family protein [Wohlfahrtiimonas chitiniclastica]
MKKLLLPIVCAVLLAGCQSIPSHELTDETADRLYHKGMQALSPISRDVNPKRAKAYFEAASEKGSAEANNALGVMYDQGIAVKQNKVRALNYYKAAADMGLAAAQYNLAVHYYENDPKNPALMYYLNEALKQNNSSAQLFLGQIQLEQGDVKKAYRNLSKAAAQEQPDALMLIAMMNKEGKGTPKDSAAARHHLMQATELGQPDAAFILGSMYLYGDGAPKNPAKALKYFEKAAELGHTKALVNLAIMHVKGEGTEIDLEKAAKLFKIAADRGDEQAKLVMLSLQNKK